MARFLGTSTTPSANAAARVSAPGWGDPRLWLGVLLVAVSVVAGARLFSAADDSVAVWAAAGDLPAGAPLESDDLVATRVHFADPGDLGGYFTVQDELPADPTMVRGVSAGELLPRAAVAGATPDDLLEVPVAVDPEQVPGSVGPGSVVDVYLVSPARPGRAPESGPALSGVTVVEAPPLAEGFSATGRRQLVLAMDDSEASRFFSLLGAGESPLVTVVRRS